ncbi:MAG: AAA family ATPase [Bacilli bacterium]|nr:AAA family ATPase [Bacilli bacterium]
MSKLIVLSGVPGSGKSYFCKTIKKIKESHVYIVSSDELRREITGRQSNLNEDELMWKIFFSLAKTYSLDKEGVVVLDATHVSKKMRVDRNKKLKHLFEEVDLVMWNIDKQIVANQNLQREYPIAPDVLERFYQILELPTEDDEKFFDKIIMVTSNDIAPVIQELGLSGSSEELPQ